MIYRCDTGERVQLTCRKCDSPRIRQVRGDTATPIRSGSRFWCRQCRQVSEPYVTAEIDRTIEE